MKDLSRLPAGCVLRSIGLQITLLILGISILFLGLAQFVNNSFDRAEMLASMEREATDLSRFLRMIIDKPMVVGDDEGTAEEFRFLARNVARVHISLSNFRGNVTYSTDESQVRKDVPELFAGRMDADDHKTFQESYSTALSGAYSSGTLVSVDGRRKFLQVQPVMNALSCHHCHGTSQPVLGAMAIFQDVEDLMLDARNRTIRNVGATATGGLLIVFSVFIFIKRRLVRRLNTLASTSDSILGGDYNAHFNDSGRDELGHLSTNLSMMLSSLKRLGVARSVLHGMQVPSVMCDVEGKVIFVNQPLLDLLGEHRKLDEVMGSPVDELIYGRSKPKHSIFAQVLRTEEVCVDCEDSLLDRRGNTLHLRFDANPVRDLEGSLCGAFGSLTDLTAIRSQQESIMKQNSIINRAAEEASGLTGEMGRATTSLAGQIEQTRQQAATQQILSDRTVDELEELNQTLSEIARNTSLAAQHAEATKQSAAEVASKADTVGTSMNELVDSTLTLKSQMEELGAKTEGVDKVLQVIQDIADQTNLLALNAAIEAARAGDAGRGFAVVADEVRKLAERTVQATVEVAQIIHEISSSSQTSIAAMERTSGAVARGSEQVQLAGQALTRILELAESLADEMRAISSAVDEQYASSESVRVSIGEIKEISREAATSTSETEEAVRALVDIALRLEKIVDGMTREEEHED